MAFLVIATWEDAEGKPTGPSFPGCTSEAEVRAAVERAIRQGRRSRGTNIRVSVMDDVTTRIVARVRPRVAT